jgi:FKBP-type peptidyl-prolyl cis-trans isomerase SlyD
MPSEVVSSGKLVALTYRITDEGGSVLEHNDLPVSYIHGGQVELVGGMDRRIEGCRVGDEVEFRVTPDQGFGLHDPSLTFTDNIDNVPPEFRVLGAEVPMQSDSGEVRSFFVTRIANGRLTVDGNHPLAGKTLSVRVKITEVREPTRDELVEDRRLSPSAGVTH